MKNVQYGGGRLAIIDEKRLRDGSYVVTFTLDGETHQAISRYDIEEQPFPSIQDAYEELRYRWNLDKDEVLEARHKYSGSEYKANEPRLIILEEKMEESHGVPIYIVKFKLNGKTYKGRTYDDQWKADFINAYENAFDYNNIFIDKKELENARKVYGI